MFSFARREQIDLAPAGGERARVLAACSKQHEFGHIAEVKADAAPIRTAVLAHLVPNDVRLIGEASRLHHGESFGQKRVRRPKIKMRRLGRQLRDGKLLEASLSRSG